MGYRKSQDIIIPRVYTVPPFSRKDYESGNDMNKMNWYMSNASAPLAMADPTNHHFHNLKSHWKGGEVSGKKKTGNQKKTEPFAASIGLFELETTMKNWPLLIPFVCEDFSLNWYDWFPKQQIEYLKDLQPFWTAPTFSSQLASLVHLNIFQQEISNLENHHG